MEIEYWRKRWVPPKCPKCGAKRYVMKALSLKDMLIGVYGSWNAVLKKHPRWGIDCWFGVCGACIFTEELKRSWF